MPKQFERNSLAFERLEGRQMMAGNVIVGKDSANNLFVRGDNLSNGIRIEQISAASYKITGLYLGGASTGIKSSSTSSAASSRVVNDVYGSVLVVMNNGSDRVEVLGSSSSNKLVVEGSLRIFAEKETTLERNATNPSSDFSGADVVKIQNVTVKDSLSVYTQKGADQVYLSSVDVWDNINIKTGYDSDFIRMIDVKAYDNIVIDTAAAGLSSTSDEVIMDNVQATIGAYPSAQSSLEIRTGKGSDKVRLRDVKADFFKCYLYDGNDLLNLIRPEWDNSWDANGGLGTNTLNRYPGPGASFGYVGFQKRTYVNSF